MKTWQVFDSEGKVVGSVTAKSIADACRQARQGYCDFPALVEMPEKVALTIQKVVEEKTNLEIWLAGMIEEKIIEFEKLTNVPVKAVRFGLIRTIFANEFREGCEVSCEIDLNINAIQE